MVRCRTIPPTVPLSPDEPQISQSAPNRFLDASDWIWPGSLFAKLVLWNSRVDSHQFSPQTEDILREYLRVNNLTDTKVRINAYNVGGELRRTLRNKSVGAGWRYPFGDPSRSRRESCAGIGQSAALRSVARALLVSQL